MNVQSVPLLRSPVSRVMAVTGTGIVVMLADTDAGSIITAAQSGAQWGYRLLLLQIILIPILFMVQELTVRLGVVTGRGHGELILQRFGRGWAWLSVSTLAIACVGALVSELSGLAGVGLLFGIPAWATMLVVIGGLVAIVWTATYRSVERIAMMFGALELLFIWIAWRAHPDIHAVVAGMKQMPLGNRAYLSGLNLIGLKRRGVDRAALHRLRTAFRILFVGDDSGEVFAERLSRVRAGAEDPLVLELLDFIEAPSRRGLIHHTAKRLEDEEPA